MFPLVKTMIQIAGVGFITLVTQTVLRQAGKEEFATWATMMGVAGVLVVVFGYVEQLYTTVERIFF